jgi:hypothetical protein
LITNVSSPCIPNIVRDACGAGALNPVIGWALAAAVVAVGFVGWGWRGVVLAVTVIVFWLLLQFSRALRVLRNAGQRPVGRIDSAVMLNAKLQPGMKLMEILPLTRSLGEKLADDPETFRWTDPGGDAVRVELVRGKLVRWALDRAGAAGEAGA